MKERNKELQARIDARDTELQRAYDMALQNLEMLSKRKETLLAQIEVVDSHMEDERKQLRLCRQRAAEQDALDIL